MRPRSKDGLPLEEGDLVRIDFGDGSVSEDEYRVAGLSAEDRGQFQGLVLLVRPKDGHHYKIAPERLLRRT